MRVLPTGLSVAVEIGLAVAVAEGRAAEPVAEARVAGSVAVAGCAVAESAVDAGCCYSSLIARHCWPAADLLRGLGSHCDNGQFCLSLHPRTKISWREASSTAVALAKLACRRQSEVAQCGCRYATLSAAGM